MKIEGGRILVFIEKYYKGSKRGNNLVFVVGFVLLWYLNLMYLFSFKKKEREKEKNRMKMVNYFYL